MDEVKQLNAVIDVIMLAGTILLRNGSEIYRVEDTMIRIAHSQGIMDCNVLAMPAAIFFSIENTNISRMKRVTSSAYNIEKVCDVNSRSPFSNRATCVISNRGTRCSRCSKHS